MNDLDLERTAELPVIDLAATAAQIPPPAAPDLGDVTVAVPAIELDDTLARTDVFEAPRFDVGAARFSDDLRDVEDRLTRKSERLAALETELATLRGEHQRYVQLAESTTDDLARQLATLRESSERDLNALHDANEQALQVARDSHATELAALREAAALELATVRDTAGRELAAARDAAAKDLAGARDSHERDRAEAKAEQVRSQDAMGKAQSAQAAAEGRATRAEQKIVEHERELQARARRIEELQGELARSSGLVRELGQERDLLRGNCDRQLEALHRAEAYRGVVDGLLFERESVSESREKEMGALVEQLAQLPQREARIGQLEGELTSLRAQTTQHVDRIAALTTDAKSWESRLAEVNASMAAAERSAQAQSEALRVAAEHAEELQQARGTAEALLADERAARETEIARATARDADLVQLRDSHSQRESELVAREAAIADRERSAEALIDDQRELLERLRTSVLAAEERASRVEGDLHAAEEQLRKLETEKRRHDGRMEELARGSEALQTRLAEAERKLEDREQRVRRLESEAHVSAAVLGNLNQSIQRLREDTGTHQAISDPPLESMDRMLIRTDGEQSVLHKIGRRTTLGRTPDNDIRLDANFVSRHHAVILASPRTTLIEDLNSTNGVIVNGRRVTRQALHDGDTIAIGTAEFRFELRPSGHVGSPD